jgi:cytidine deaminase
MLLPSRRTALPGNLSEGHEIDKPAPRTRTSSSFTIAARFPEGAAIRTDDTIYLGFGLEGVTGAATRTAAMGRAMAYLLR